MDSKDFTDRVRKVVTMLASSATKPPFTEAQLITMAMIAQPLLRGPKQILDWIFDNFAYYRQLSRHALWLLPKYVKRDPDTSDQAQEEYDFRSNFDAVFWSYEMPLRTRISQRKKKCAISEVDARKLLQPVLGKCREDDSVFSFFELPAEVRTTVYEHLLRFPSSGIYVMRPRYAGRIAKPSPNLAVLSRSLSDHFSRSAWEDATSRVDSNNYPSPHGDSMLRTRPITKVPSPLLVNHQFYREAMPIFYELNRFHFVGSTPLEYALRSLSPTRRRYITHVSAEDRFTKDDDAYALFACCALGKLDGLRRLDICLDERYLRDNVGGLSMPGLQDLKMLRGLEEVEFHGDCPRLEAMLKGEVLQPRFEESKRKRKRKELNGDELFVGV